MFIIFAFVVGFAATVAGPGDHPTLCNDTEICARQSGDAPGTSAPGAAAAPAPSPSAPGPAAPSGPAGPDCD